MPADLPEKQLATLAKYFGSPSRTMSIRAFVAHALQQNSDSIPLSDLHQWQELILVEVVLACFRAF
jgi:hypothetical protein